MSLEVVKDSTDVILYIFITDSVTGVIETGFDVTTLDFQYTRTGAAPSVKQENWHTVSHLDSYQNSPPLCQYRVRDNGFHPGFKHINPVSVLLYW